MSHSDDDAEKRESDPLLGETSSDTRVTYTNNLNGDQNQPQQKQRATFSGLFKYATKCDKCRLAGAVLCAVAAAFLQAFAFFVAFEPYTIMLEYEGTERNSTNGSSTELVEQVESDTIRATIMVAVLTVIIFTYVFGYVAVSITKRVRRKYLRQLLSLDMAWTQTNASGDQTVMLDQNLHKMSDALENNIPETLMQILDVSCCIVLSLVVRWDLTLVTSAFTLPTIAFYVFGTRHYLRMLANEDSFISRATELVAESFQAIKTVICFNGQRQTIQKYKNSFICTVIET